MSWKASAYVRNLRQHVDGTPLTPHAKLVLFVLADCHNEDQGAAWISVRRMAEAALISERQCQYVLRECEDRQTIRTVKRPGETNLYAFSGLDAKPQEARKEAHSTTSKGRTVCTPKQGEFSTGFPQGTTSKGCTSSCTPGVHTVCTLTSIEPQEEKRKPGTAKTAVQSPTHLSESQRHYATIRRLAERAEFLLRREPTLGDGDAGEILKGWAATVGLEYFWAGTGNSPVVQALIIARARINPSREPGKCPPAA